MYSDSNRPANTSDSVIDESVNRQTIDENNYGEHKILARSLSPMLKMMRVWGLYFGFYGRSWGINKPYETQLQEKEQYNKNDGRKPASGRTVIIPTLALLIVWINVLRFSLAFQAGNTLNSSTINKIAFFSMYLQGAVTHTSYFIVSRRGELDQFLGMVTVTEKFAERVRKHAVACIVYSFLMAISSCVAGIYSIFMSVDTFSFVMTPFVSLIPVDLTSLYVLKAILFVAYLFIMQSWVWSFMMNLMLSAILFTLFRQCNHRFLRATDRRGRLSVNLKTLRRRHQAISEAVRVADSFMKLGNVASIVCQMAAVITVLYELTTLGFTDPIFNMTFLSVFTANVVGLTVCILCGVMVNYAVSSVK
jgi:hypothetical protein